MEFRTARPEEVRQIVDLANYVFRTSSGLEPSMGRQYPIFLSPENASNLYIAVEDGKIVSHIGIYKNNAYIRGHRVSMAGMGSVCTHPDYRGRGLATKLLHYVFESLEEQGVSLLKISGNRGLYKTNGCLEIESITSCTFDGESPFDDAKFGAGGGYKYSYIADPQDTSILADIYHREPVRYERSKWLFPVLFKAMPTVHPPAGRVYTAVVASIQSSNSGIAYAIGYEREPGNYEIIEYAGERSAVPGMIQYLIKQKNMKQVKIYYPTYDTVLTELFASIASTKEEMLSSMTVKIINRQTLWEQIFPIIQERWPGKNPPKSLEDLQEIADKQGEPLIKFLFGDYQRPSYGAPWDEVLPIELPWFNGLSYV